MAAIEIVAPLALVKVRARANTVRRLFSRNNIGGFLEELARVYRVALKALHIDTVVVFTYCNITNVIKAEELAIDKTLRVVFRLRLSNAVLN
jgi:hypothetical protein